jgi:hypothetical protein
MAPLLNSESTIEKSPIQIDAELPTLAVVFNLSTSQIRWDRVVSHEIHQAWAALDWQR